MSEEYGGVGENVRANDIRHDAFNYGNMHFGPTGADNDASTPGEGVRLGELVMGAPENAKGGSDGSQQPRDGKGDLK